MVRSLTWEQVWTHRLVRHALLEPAPAERLVEVVRDVCGIHAQVMQAAEMSIGVRVDEITRQDVRGALWERRSLVKTYGLRGTVHLFPADEFSLWIAALRGARQPNEERRLEGLGLSQEQVDAIVRAIDAALDGRCLTREELGGEVGRRAGAWALDEVSPAFGGYLPRWQIALGAAALASVLCFGPNQGTKVTYVRPDQWLGGWSEMDEMGALRTVARRYLAAYGPATHRDFAQWLSMPPRTARDVFTDLASELEEVDVEGYRSGMLAGDADIPGPARDTVHLLPHFDCYVIGCHPRDRLVPPAHADRALTRGSAGNLPVVLVNGTVAGIWRHKRSGKRLEIAVDMFEEPNSQVRAGLEDAAARIGAIVEAVPSLSLTRIEARPHL